MHERPPRAFDLPVSWQGGLTTLLALVPTFAIAVAILKRSTLVPDLPTVAEAGYRGFQTDTWYGVLAPARTPAAIVSQLNTDIGRLLKMRDVQAQLEQQGAEAAGGTPQEFRAFAQAEIARWSKVIRAAGIEAN